MSQTNLRRAVAVFGGLLPGLGISSYVEAVRGNIHGGVTVAGLGAGLMVAALVRE